MRRAIVRQQNDQCRLGKFRRLKSHQPPPGAIGLAAQTRYQNQHKTDYDDHDQPPGHSLFIQSAIVRVGYEGAGAQSDDHPEQLLEKEGRVENPQTATAEH